MSGSKGNQKSDDGSGFIKPGKTAIFRDVPSYDDDQSMGSDFRASRSKRKNKGGSAKRDNERSSGIQEDNVYAGRPRQGTVDVNVPSFNGEILPGESNSRDRSLRGRRIVASSGVASAGDKADDSKESDKRRSTKTERDTGNVFVRSYDMSVGRKSGNGQGSKNRTETERYEEEDNEDKPFYWSDDEVTGIGRFGAASGDSGFDADESSAEAYYPSKSDRHGLGKRKSSIHKLRQNPGKTESADTSVNTARIRSAAEFEAFVDERRTESIVRASRRNHAKTEKDSKNKNTDKTYAAEDYDALADDYYVGERDVRRNPAKAEKDDKNKTVKAKAKRRSAEDCDVFVGSYHADESDTRRNPAKSGKDDKATAKRRSAEAYDVFTDDYYADERDTRRKPAKTEKDGKSKTAKAKAKRRSAEAYDVFADDYYAYERDTRRKPAKSENGGKSKTSKATVKRRSAEDYDVFVDDSYVDERDVRRSPAKSENGGKSKTSKATAKRRSAEDYDFYVDDSYADERDVRRSPARTDKDSGNSKTVSSVRRVGDFSVYRNGSSESENARSKTKVDTRGRSKSRTNPARQKPEFYVENETDTKNKAPVRADKVSRISGADTSRTRNNAADSRTYTDEHEKGANRSKDASKAGFGSSVRHKSVFDTLKDKVYDIIYAASVKRDERREKHKNKAEAAPKRRNKRAEADKNIAGRLADSFNMKIRLPRNIVRSAFIYAVAVILCLVAVFNAAKAGKRLIREICTVKSITVNGKTDYSDSDIIKASCIKMGDCILDIDSSAVEKTIRRNNPYILAEVEKSGIDKVIINVKMCSAYAAIVCSGGYVLIDKDAVALEFVSDADFMQMKDKLTVVEGLETIGYSCGELIGDSETDIDINNLTELLKIINDAQLKHRISRVDITNMLAMTLTTVDGMTVKVGDRSNLAEKLKFADEYADKLEAAGRSLNGILSMEWGVDNSVLYTAPSDDTLPSSGAAGSDGAI